AALADLRTSGNLPIPRHLRDGHYAGSKDLGNAQDYKYPHAYPEKWVKQQYLPDKLKKANYFDANETGKYERALGANKDRIDKLSQ
ncbi:replication-associated recombination protein A, partial [Streptococcus pluranimalium]